MAKPSRPAVSAHFAGELATENVPGSEIQEISGQKASKFRPD
jgi:hypothetical protein